MQQHASAAIGLEQARRLILERTRALQVEPVVALADALGRVLAEDARASEPVPAFDNSAMDGFAVRAVDTAAATRQAPVALRVVDESRAGRPSAISVGPDEAVRISTGAMLPEGADAIVRKEDAIEEPEAVAERDTNASSPLVRVLVPVDPGDDVRRAGDDIQTGALVLSRGSVLGPAELGVLASLGRATIACARRPEVALLTTGDELLDPGEQYRPGGVRNTNAYTIGALIERSGGHVVLGKSVSDDAQSTREAIGAALGRDVLIVCGGVSVGEHDHVRAALADCGVEEVFWRVALRPGSPAWFGVARDGGLAFGLPGNPVSAMVTFLLLVSPALAAMQGGSADRRRTKAVFDEMYAKRPGRAHALRCRLELRDDGWHARLTGSQGSHILTSMLGAEALAILPADSDGVKPGESVEIELLPRG